MFVVSVMSDYATLQKTLIRKALILSVLVASVFLALDLTSAAKGIALGSMFSVVEFKLMALRLPVRLANRGRLSGYLGLLGRFVLLAIPLVVAIKVPAVSFSGTVGGIFSVKAAIFYHFFVENRLFAAHPKN